uniref:NADH:ubiquinone reductase (H(+)-translocating) n=1 Tax=Pegea confoederata TaxID=942563 RepID=A0AA86M1V3_9UROC|nr:NADH dehydrogenase subunit 5 [Pegea confoederata]
MFFSSFLNFNYSLSNYCNISFTLISFSVWLSVALVIVSFVWFVPWYMESECSKGMFYCLIGVFSFSILMLSVVNFGLLFMLTWEMLGICSYMLVRWWGGRDMARTMAVVGIISSRMGDFFLFLLYMGYFQDNSLLSLISCMMAVSSKSAQLFYFPWLLGAMEGPGPVSALLHSSTLVLAGVVLGYYLTYFGMGNSLLISGGMGLILGVLGTMIFVDLKKRVACSTVYNVGLMFMWLGLDSVDILSVHLVTHALLKSCAFSVLGVTSHLSTTQDTRMTMGNNGSYLVVFFKVILMVLSFIPLVGLIYMKELMVESVSYMPSSTGLVGVMVIISFAGMLFSLESLLSSTSGYIIDHKFVCSPNFNMVYLILGYIIVLMFMGGQQCYLSSSNGAELGFFSLLGVGLACLTVTYFRSSFNNSKYLVEYNNYFFGPNGSKASILYNFEFMSLAMNSSSSFYSAYFYRSFKLKVSYAAISFTLAFIMLVILLW